MTQQDMTRVFESVTRDYPRELVERMEAVAKELDVNAVTVLMLYREGIGELQAYYPPRQYKGVGKRREIRRVHFDTRGFSLGWVQAYA